MLHRAGVGSGRVCPLHGDPGRRLPQAGGGRQGGVRGRAGSQGLAGAERPQGLTDLRIADRAGSGNPRARFFPDDYIGPMRARHFACSSLLLPVVLAAQAPPAYRGFSPGRAYRDFATRAQALARRDTLRCNTSKRTAQLMECGVQIRDPSDSTNFYLSAYVIEGKVAILSFGNSA